MKIWKVRWAVSVLILILGSTACSEKPAEKPRAAPPAGQATPPSAGAQPAAPPSQPAAPAAQPATAVPAGDLATEKHILVLHNYARSPVTVTLGGEWVGQWDAHSEVPLSSVQRGKNDLLVEVAGEAKGAITLYIQAVRNNQRVNLMTLNFEGKPGKHAFSFAAK